MTTDPRIIATPRPRTGHDLPPAMSSFANWLPPNTVAHCGHCDHLFVVRVAGDDYGSHVWTRLRWWHRTAHRLLRESQ